MSNPNTPQPQPPQQPPSPSEFNHSLAKISVAQILHTVGFTSASSAALDSLSRVTALFLRHLSSSSAASADSVPSFHDVVSAIDGLNFPLDFSIPHLSRFLSTSDHLPFPRLVPKPDFIPPRKPPSTAADDGVCRRAEVPSWLPAFPQIIKDSDGNIGSDFCDDDEKEINKEVYWEKRRCLSTKAVKETAKENHVIRKTKRGGKRSVVVCGRRERVKFKLGVRRKGDDLELKNGVCRGHRYTKPLSFASLKSMRRFGWFGSQRLGQGFSKTLSCRLGGLQLKRFEYQETRATNYRKQQLLIIYAC